MTATNEPYSLPFCSEIRRCENRLLCCQGVSDPGSPSAGFLLSCPTACYSMSRPTIWTWPAPRYWLKGCNSFWHYCVRFPRPGFSGSSGNADTGDRRSRCNSPTGSPEAVTRLQLPQNVACGFPALRSSESDSQHGDCPYCPIGQYRALLLFVRILLPSRCFFSLYRRPFLVSAQFSAPGALQGRSGVWVSTQLTVDTLRHG